MNNLSRVFGQSYVASCSSVDGQAAFRHKEGDQRHIEYFQSLEKFHEDGLPDKLPAHLEEELKQDPQLCQLEAEVQALMGDMGAMGDNQAFSTAKRRLTTYSRRLKRDALRLYQETWVPERRDWKILTRGKEVAQDHSKTELAQDIYKLFPERGRLAARMASTQPLTSDDMWHALGDLQALCLHDSNVLYLPGSRPVDGACPVKACQRQMNRVLYLTRWKACWTPESHVGDQDWIPASLEANKNRNRRRSTRLGSSFEGRKKKYEKMMVVVNLE